MIVSVVVDGLEDGAPSKTGRLDGMVDGPQAVDLRVCSKIRLFLITFVVPSGIPFRHDRLGGLGWSSAIEKEATESARDGLQFNTKTQKCYERPFVSDCQGTIHTVNENNEVLHVQRFITNECHGYNYLGSVWKCK